MSTSLPRPLVSERVLGALALFLAVVGARFWLVARYGVSLPYWDQWDAEGAGLIKPWLEGRLDWRVFFAAHNEHRIVLTRLLALGLFTANGQWDGVLEMAVNALGCGLGAVALAAMFGGGRLALLAVGVCWILPFGWENTLCGFQSQNYFLIFFSLAAVWGLVTGAAGSTRWWVGIGALALACLSMATGFFAAAAVLGTQLATRRRPARGELITMAICAIAVALGWFTRVEVPAHAVLKAESVSAFLWALGRFAAWPWGGYPIFAAVVYLPVAALAARAFPRERFLLTAGAWTFLQTAAMAYGRGGHGAPPACRYMDLLAVAPLLGVLCWAKLLGGELPARWRRPAWAAALVWTALLFAGLWHETRRDFRDWMPGYRGQMQRSEVNVRGYLQTGDYARFLADKPLHDLPFPNPTRLAGLLDDPGLRAVLPADVHGRLGRWSYWAGFVVRRGYELFFAGLAVATALCCRALFARHSAEA